MSRKGSKKDNDGTMDARTLEGAYYSPTSLVKFMCQKCLGFYLAQATTISREDIDDLVLWHGADGIPRGIDDHLGDIDVLLRDIKIIDPAAGNGAFLGGMLDAIVTVRCVVNPGLASDRGIDSLRQDVAMHALHGVDIDPEAIQVARAMLRQSCAAGDETTIESMNFALSQNIVHGDTVKDAIYLDDPSISPRTWRSHFSTIFGKHGGFDIVISNPPYLSYYSNTLNRLSTEDRQGVKQAFKTVRKQNDRINAMNLFIEKGIDVLRPGGVLAYIVNKTVGVLPSYQFIRRYLLEQSVLDYVFTDLDFFDAVVDCMVLQLQKQVPQANYDLRWCSMQGTSLVNESLQDFFSRNSSMIPITEFKMHRKLEFNHSRYEAILEKIEQAPLKLRDILTVNRGVNIGGCSEYFLSPEKTDARYERIILDASYIGRYMYTWDNSQGYFIFDAAKERELRALGKTLVLGNPARYEHDKLFIPEASQALIAAYVPELIYSAYGILVGTNDNAIALKCACAMMNSRVFTFYAIERQILRKGKKATPHVGVKGLNEMPVPLFTADDIDRLNSFVDQILTVTSKEDYMVDTRLRDTEQIMMNKIDDFLFRSYGLDEAEIDVILRATDPTFK